MRGLKRARIDQTDLCDTPRFGDQLPQTHNTQDKGILKKLTSIFATKNCESSPEKIADEDVPPVTYPLSDVTVSEFDEATGRPTITFLPDLAALEHGGRVTFATDEFFGEARNLLMDGCHRWETRRRRAAGHDWVLIELGRPTIIRGIEIDCDDLADAVAPSVSIEVGLFNNLDADLIQYGTSTFPLLCEMTSKLGADKMAKTISVKSTFKNRPLPSELIKGFDEVLDHQPWDEILPLTRIRCGRHHFAIDGGEDKKVNYLRMNLMPDGAIRRLHVYGECRPASTLMKLEEADQPNRTLDYANVQWGGWPLWASSGRETVRYLSASKSEISNQSWRTPRQPLRPPVVFENSSGNIQFTGEEVAIIRLGQRCLPKLMQIDCTEVEGEAPHHVHVEAIDAPQIWNLPLLKQMELCKDFCLQNWIPLVLKASVSDSSTSEFRFVATPKDQEDTTPTAQKYRGGHPIPLPPGMSGVTHLRLTLVPDGTITRLRFYGQTASGKATSLSTPMTQLTCSGGGRRRSTAQLIVSLNNAFAK